MDGKVLKKNIIICRGKNAFSEFRCSLRDVAALQLIYCTSFQVLPASDVMKILTLELVSSGPTTPEHKTKESMLNLEHLNRHTEVCIVFLI